MSNNNETNIEPVHINLDGKNFVILPADFASKMHLSRHCEKKECSGYRSVFISSVDVMVIADMDGTIVDVNPPVFDKFGYLPDEIIGQPQDILLPDPLKSKFKEFVENIKNNQRPKKEFMGLRKNGELFHSEIRGIPFTFLSKPHMLTVIRNITSRKRAERTIDRTNKELKKVNRILNVQNRALYKSRIAAVKLKEEAEKSRAETEQINKQLKASTKKAMLATKAKSEFLANMSHEIRTPMNAIIGFSDLLSGENLDESQKEYVEMILKSGETLLAIINDILDFSKIEAGELKIETIPCSLSGIIKDIETFVKPMAARNNLEYKTILSDGLPETIYTDPVRLRQCLINFITNAIKFTDKGHVYLKISIETKGETKMLRYDVEDTGVGIPTDKQQIIFDSFSQADGSTTRKFGGTGLGLAITNNLSSLMDGEISVESQVGKGSVFTMLLPLKNGDETISEKEINVNSDQNTNLPESDMQLNANILVAEDNPSNQMLVKILLEKMGTNVTIVEDGQQAVEEALSGTFDAILMDMQMPKMNGYQATKSLRDKGCDLPIIALTANAMKGDAEKCKEAGCDDYLSKPITKSQLYDTLTTCLQSRCADDSGQDENGCSIIKESDLVSELENDPTLTPVIDVFVNELPDLLTEIDSAFGQSDIDQLKAVTHRLKGASLSAGFTVLSEFVKNVEGKIINEDIASAKDSIDELNSFCIDVIKRQKSL